MFGHLKPEDFMNLIDGSVKPAVHKNHLDSCTQCREVWESMKPLHAEVASLDAEIAEPDWMQFRSSVRDQLLWRSVQRQSPLPWNGWLRRPALAWALSLLLAVGIPTGAFLWHLEKEDKAPAAVQTLQPLPAAELIEAGMGKMVFDEVIELNDSEQQQFQQLLEAQTGNQRVQ